MSENGGLCFEKQKQKQTTNTQKKPTNHWKSDRRWTSQYEVPFWFPLQQKDECKPLNVSTRAGQGCNNHFIAPWWGHHLNNAIAFAPLFEKCWLRKIACIVEKNCSLSSTKFDLFSLKFDLFREHRFHLHLRRKILSTSDAFDQLKTVTGLSDLQLNPNIDIRGKDKIIISKNYKPWE